MESVVDVNDLMTRKIKIGLGNTGDDGPSGEERITWDTRDWLRHYG